MLCEARGSRAPSSDIPSCRAHFALCCNMHLVEAQSAELTTERFPGSPMGGTTGVSLEQGLGLGDISRGRPGRRPGGECSSVSDYYFIINKINPSS